ncbi:MAG: ABC transporter permease [Candidatus Rokuibacteriota bacterium]
MPTRSGTSSSADASPASPPARPGLWAPEYLLPAATLVVLVLAWEAATHLFRIPTWILPAPSHVAAEAWNHRAQLPGHAWRTLWETLAGFGLSILVGVPLAAMIASSPLLHNTIYPLLVVTQSVPKVAIAPLIVIFMGVGDMPKILVAFLVAFFPVVVDTATGLNAVPPELIDLSRSLKASRFQEFVKIRFPTAVPFLFSGLKVAVALSVVGAVVGEFVQADKGLGYLIVVSTTYWRTGLAFAALVLLSLMGIALFAAVALVERVFFYWYTADQA